MRLRHKEGLNEYLEVESRSLENFVVIRRAQTTKEAIEDLLWVVFAIVIVYLGDCDCNFVSILLWDPRINRIGLLLGLSGASLTFGMIVYSMICSSTRLKFHQKLDLMICSSTRLKFHQKLDLSNVESTTSIEEKPETFLEITRSILLIGISSFCMILYALWPIWSFLSILLLLSLQMSSIAILPYLLGAVTKVQILPL